MIGIISSYNYTISHMLPRNVGVLRPFIILVELVSSLVRPLTLAFRLAANITAGHVILGLTARGGAVGIALPIFYYAFEVIIR